MVKANKPNPWPGTIIFAASINFLMNFFNCRDIGNHDIAPGIAGANDDLRPRAQMYFLPYELVWISQKLRAGIIVPKKGTALLNIIVQI
jgi:hypothetical protein